MDITDVFTNITPLTISDSEARLLLVEVLKRDVTEVDEYLANDLYAYDVAPSDTCTLDERYVETVGDSAKRSQPVGERCLRLVPDPR
jgi:hypothetical protein